MTQSMMLTDETYTEINAVDDGPVDDFYDYEDDDWDDEEDEDDCWC